MLEPEEADIGNCTPIRLGLDGNSEAFMRNTESGRVEGSGEIEELAQS